MKNCGGMTDGAYCPNRTRFYRVTPEPFHLKNSYGETETVTFDSKNHYCSDHRSLIDGRKPKKRKKRKENDLGKQRKGSF